MRFPLSIRSLARVALLGCAAGWSAGCAQVLPPPEVLRAAIANPEPSLHLVDGDRWRVFEVRHAIFGRRLLLREELATGGVAPEPLVVRWKGGEVTWFDPATFWIDERLYERNRHRANYRMQHPWTGEEWILAARAISQSAGDVSLPPVEENAPHLTFLEKAAGRRDEPRQVGELSYDAASRRLCFGRIGEQDVEIEQVDVTAFDREPGLLQHFFSPYPESGEFVIRIDGRETARFLQRHDGGTEFTFRLAIRTDLGDADRDRSLWLFFAFDRMMAFVRSTV